MYALISPAKRLDLDPLTTALPTTLPDLLGQSEVLAKKLRGLSKKKLGALMKLSDGLTDLNYERFQAWSPPFTPENAKPAALTFAGDTYLGLEAGTLKLADLEWAQDRIGILSGLYGLLRPLDLIQPYRLEMGTQLSTRRGKNLYAFWGERLSQSINDRTADHANRAVINLASKEYFSAVQTKRLDSPVITPLFKEVKNGQAKVVGFMAKKARGMMARHIVDERIEQPEALKDFNKAGYTYQQGASTDTLWVFSRPSTTA
jgi:cytoplasmic iron level regulating protein YaaA (DUF328/UPF0246 family)